MTVDEPARQPLDVLEIRSYRTVFDLERRIYRIDRLRLNPQGVPLRGLVYLVALVLGTAAGARLPLVGTALRAVPWYVRDVAGPAGLATLLASLRIEGRAFHLAAGAVVRLATRPRWLSGLRPARRPGRVWRPPDLVLVSDGSDAAPRRLRYTGPGAVLVACPHERLLWRGGHLPRLAGRPDLTVRRLPGRAAPGRAQVVEVAPGARLAVEQAARGR